METFEVLKVLEFDSSTNTVEDTDSLGEVELDMEDEQSILDALSDFGIDLPFTWDIQVDDSVGVIAIYDDTGTYQYQLRSC